MRTWSDPRRLAHNRVMLRLALAVVVALGCAAAGCATAQAKGEPAGPALVPPVPPPHYITPVEVAPAEPAPPAEPGPTPVIVRPSPRPPAPRAERRADKPGERAGTDAAAAAPQPAAGTVSSPLQTTANVAELERGVRVRMAQALRDLERTDYRALSPDRRTQYDTARRFVQQAEDALKERNLVFAEQLADKAATLASALVRR